MGCASVYLTQRNPLINTNPKPRLAAQLLGALFFLALFLWRLNAVQSEGGEAARWLTYAQAGVYGGLGLWLLVRCVRGSRPQA